VSLLLLVLAMLTGCGDTLSPDRVEIDGHWTINFGQGPSDFHLELVETAGGVITGTWSYPQSFAFYRVRGRREGLQINLTADSPNIFPSSLQAAFVGRNRLEGTLQFGGTVTVISLNRGRGWN
jgi:hypothetical protein